MERNQSKDIDFSDYRPSAGATPAVAATTPDFERQEKKKKIQLAVIIVCLILAVGFWGYYFYQQDARTRTVNYEMVPE
ncbi:MAG: hypothetical protein WA093_01430 [Minisyncoccales bacterium]|jgi:uncharacterized protein HemX